MMLQTQSDPRRLEAANATHRRRVGRPAEWVLSVVFAGLLGTAVWKLDHASADPQTPGPSAALTPGLVARSAGFARELLESLIVRERPDRGLSATQSAPEGWPTWGSEQAFRPPTPQCVRAEGPRDPAAACH